MTIGVKHTKVEPRTEAYEIDSFEVLEKGMMYQKNAGTFDSSSIDPKRICAGKSGKNSICYTLAELKKIAQQLSIKIHASDSKEKYVSEIRRELGL